jgi:hypothetical protein
MGGVVNDIQIPPGANLGGICIARLFYGGYAQQPVVKSTSAGDADPGALLRRRRREVALDSYITRVREALLDAQPTESLRFLSGNGMTYRMESIWLILRAVSSL